MFESAIISLSLSVPIPNFCKKYSWTARDKALHCISHQTCTGRRTDISFTGFHLLMNESSFGRSPVPSEHQLELWMTRQPNVLSAWQRGSGVLFIVSLMQLIKNGNFVILSQWHPVTHLMLLMIHIQHPSLDPI